MARHKGRSPLVGFNRKRAAWAQRALRTFMSATGLTKADGLNTAFSDLLADLMHLADHLRKPFPALLREAGSLYRAETGATCALCRRRFDRWSDAAGTSLDICTECDSKKGGRR